MMLIARKGFALVLWTAAALVAAQPATGFAQAGSDSQMANALTNLDQYVKDSMAKTKVPGVSVAVVYQDLRQGVLDSSTNYSQEKPPGNPSPGTPVSSFLGTY